MDEDDEEVVFTNTALYDHLVSSGFSDFESASCLEEAVSHTAEAAARSQRKVCGVKERLMTTLDWLRLRSGPLLAAAALSALRDSGLMSDRDRAVVADLSSDQRQDTATPLTEITDSFLLAVLVSAVALAACLPASCLLLSVALVSCAGVAAVARVRTGVGRRRVHRFCRTAGELRRTGLRCCRLLQESHLMARGVTLSSGDPGAEAAFTAQYGELVQAAGACLNAACAAFGRATRQLRCFCPLLDGVDVDRHYVAYDEAALAAFTEHQFSVKDTKTLQQLLSECQSEFVRRCCLGLSSDLLPLEHCGAPPVPLQLLSDLSDTLRGLQRRLSAAYRAHAALWSAEPTPAAAAASSAAGDRQQLYVGVHSVCLQAQVVALRARMLEEVLSEAGDGAEREPQLHGRLRRELAEIQQRLGSSQLFCEQTLLRLSRMGDRGEAQQSLSVTPPTAAGPADAPPLLDLPEPEVVDQFFEAVVEGNAPTDEDSEDEMLSRERQLQCRLERDKARELLKELNVALTGKREEWRIREAVASGRPVEPPPLMDQRESSSLEPAGDRDGHDPYKVNKADLYEFSGSEEECEAGRHSDVTDSRRQLCTRSASEGEATPVGSLVLPPIGDLTHLLPVRRRAPPPARRPPSRPSSVAGTPRQVTSDGDPARRGTASRPGPTAAGTALQPPGGGVGERPLGAGAGGAARYRAAALGLPSRQGFPAEMAAQAAALALRRRRQPAEQEEVFGESGSDGDD